MKTALIVITILIAGPIVVLALGIGVHALWFGSRAVHVAKRETDPVNLQRKYEWFKDAAAALDQKVATITVYDARFKDMERTYKDVPRNTWAREDREQYNLWMSEAAGIRASYNQLASEYNSMMAKWNWQFCEVGTLPPGATQPLPREYKPYITQ